MIVLPSDGKDGTNPLDLGEHAAKVPGQDEAHALGARCVALVRWRCWAGCVSHSTGETEVGVLVCKIGLGCAHKGVQEQLYPPGSTNLFAPFIRDFYTFDTKVQNLEMTATAKGGDRVERDDLQFKTTDGNDISMDVTVVWTIDPKLVPSILQNVGTSTDEVKEKLVRPMARTLVRDVLNELDSEAVYNSDKRFQKADKARAGADGGARGASASRSCRSSCTSTASRPSTRRSSTIASWPSSAPSSSRARPRPCSRRRCATSRRRAASVASDIAQGRRQAQAGLAQGRRRVLRPAAERRGAPRRAHRQRQGHREAQRGAARRGRQGHGQAQDRRGARGQVDRARAGRRRRASAFNKMDVNKLIDTFKDEPASDTSQGTK